ncbi:MAG: hypothetical protein MZV63_14165 [Marinilabiliales bacterium]|nr:hypothetical protein [Marinilabiliales bacterium]
MRLIARRARARRPTPPSFERGDRARLALPRAGSSIWSAAAGAASRTSATPSTCCGTTRSRSWSGGGSAGPPSSATRWAGSSRWPAARARGPGWSTSPVLMCGAGAAPLPRYLRRAAPLALRRALPVLVPALRRRASSSTTCSSTRPSRTRTSAGSASRRCATRPAIPTRTASARVCTTLCVDIAERGFLGPDLPALRMPVLGLWGDHGKLTALTPVLRQLGRIPRVRTVVLPRCGHMPMVERPAEHALPPRAVPAGLRRSADSRALPPDRGAPSRRRRACGATPGRRATPASCAPRGRSSGGPRRGRRRPPAAPRARSSAGSGG